MTLATLALQVLLFVGAPLALGLWLRRRWALSAWPMAVGAVTFAASQVVRLPALWLLDATVQPPEDPSLALALNASMLGLAAGLAEEWARYAAFRLVLPSSRSHREAILFGVGHGGIESFVLGVMVGAGGLATLAMARAGVERMGLPPEAEAPVRAAIEQLHAPGTQLLRLLAVGERAIAICLHVSMSALVAAGVRLGRLWPVWLAVLLHAFFDGAMVAVARLHGPVAAELFLLAVLPVAAAALIASARMAPARRGPAPEGGR